MAINFFNIYYYQQNTPNIHSLFIIISINNNILHTLFEFSSYLLIQFIINLKSDKKNSSIIFPHYYSNTPLYSYVKLDTLKVISIA